MLRRPGRLLAGLFAALVAAPAVAVGTAGVAQADAVRAQELWVLNAIDAPTAWQTTMGRGVTVAVIDSGVNGSVSDLTGSVIKGRDFTGVNTTPANPHWGVHGTWMASLIAAHGHPAGSSNGIVGVAPQAHILSIRAVTDQKDPGDRRYEHESEAHVQNELAAAIDYAAKSHVQVISMSLGYQGASLPVRVAIKDALAKGIVVVASSGNSGGASGSRGGNAPYSFPADYPGVLGVGAVGRSGAPAHFSSNNLSVQVAAPGVKVPAQGRDGQYWLVSGTSPACALTAGVAALIKSRYPALPPALAVQAITASTWHRPHGGYDEEVGFGTVNAVAALKMAARLAHDSSTGQGLAAAVRFGGGPSAIGPVPVAPRGTRQLIIDIMLALACLALLAGSAFWLIVTRGGPADAALSAGSTFGPPVRYGPPTGPPAGYRPADGYQPQGGYRSSDGHPPPDGYGPHSGYGPSSGPPASGYGPPSGPPASGYGPPSGPPASGYGPPSGPPASRYGPASGPGAEHGPRSGPSASAGYGPRSGPSASRYGPPSGPPASGPSTPFGGSAGSPDGYGPLSESRDGHEAPSRPSAGYWPAPGPSASHGTPPDYRAPASPEPPGGPAEGPPFSGDTRPTQGQ